MSDKEAFWTLVSVSYMFALHLIPSPFAAINGKSFFLLLMKIFCLVLRNEQVQVCYLPIKSSVENFI